MVVQIRRATGNQLVEEKVRIVLEGLRGETLISELYRRERIAPTMYYRRLKALWESGKSGLTRNTQRDAAAIEDRALKEENATLKKAIEESASSTVKKVSHPSTSGSFLGTNVAIPASSKVALRALSANLAYTDIG